MNRFFSGSCPHPKNHSDEADKGCMILQGDSRQKANHIRSPLGYFKAMSIVVLTDTRNQFMSSGEH